MAHGGEPDVGKVLDGLQRQTGAHLALVADDADTVESSTAGFPREVLASLSPVLARIAGGQLAAAATSAGEWHVRCEALESHPPRPVLVLASASQPSPETVVLASHTGSVVALLRSAGARDRTWRGYQHKAHQVRFAVLHALLAGDPLLARRMTTGAVPPLLDADRLRIHLLRCPSADRDGIARAYQDPSGYHGPGLLVHCPVFKEHLICLIPDDAGVGGGSGKAHGLEQTLRRLVRDNPRYALGISGPQPLGSTAQAYSQANHALAAARTTPDRVAFHHGQTSLDGILPHRPALAWARAVLRPLAQVPPASTDIAHLSLSMPRAGVARLLNLSRNTVTTYIGQVEDALGLDLTDVRTRAEIHLAFALSDSLTGPEPDGEQPPPPLEELLSVEPAAAWAGSLLRPLRPQHRRTLQAWIDANADAQRAAHRMGISRNTVRAHLRTTEAVLGLDLLTSGTGIHELVHALRITSSRAV
ncbi:PucR family transcriptional regulator [Streptomyces sp. HNM0574]|nr:helix-turn-helix domain-containing protein [Streptomyces sp. HNM0574]NLU70458.1 PucR family transcriptional regulator [Streptomyces sp. HNM0574]